MPIPNPNDILPKLEELGVDEVRKRLAMGVYAEYKRKLIEEWIRRKEQEASRVAPVVDEGVADAKVATRVDRVLQHLKNHPVMAGVIIVGVVLIAVGNLTDALTKIEAFARRHGILAGPASLYAASDFVGTWSATGYMCEGPEPPEVLIITVSAGTLTATKRSGDACISAGDITWVGAIKGDRISIKFHRSRGPGGQKYWSDEEIKIINQDFLQHQFIEYRRK